MKLFFYNIFLFVIISTGQSSIYSNLKDSVLNLLQGSEENKNVITNEGPLKHRDDKIDGRIAKKKAKIVIRAKELEDDLNDFGMSLPRDVKSPHGTKERYHMVPVLNYLKRRVGTFRRKSETVSTSDSSSSSVELKNWKDEWKEHWLEKKFEAVNATQIRGDSVNMLGARPWGVPCGDSNQHDMPWGTCMLPMECESEYRIYRGDYFCGRTQFVCCALQQTTYDLYQGFDVSFADSSLGTDSEEKRYKGRGSKKKKLRKRLKEKNKRKIQRLKRKRQIKRNIRKIIKEIRKILNRSYRNGTTARKKKTKQLKKFIKELKKKFKKDRKSVTDIHELELIKIDATLQKKLNQIRDMNQQFIKNTTFRDIIVNGTITKEGARMLLEAYPEMASYLKTRRNNYEPKDYMDYDVEYGEIYY